MLIFPMVHLIAEKYPQGINFFSNLLNDLIMELKLGLTAK